MFGKCALYTTQKHKLDIFLHRYLEFVFCMQFKVSTIRAVFKSLPSTAAHST